jgi:UDP-N-acetylmuramoyl-tripeptide--D-alanyl-D-alanine ligase
LPLTLLKLCPAHQFAVVEMGMNHRGEIRYLTQIAKPNVVVINNAGNAHLGELGSYQAIAEAKGEIIEGLAEDGVVVLNADDQFFPLWEKLAQGKKIISFGFGASSDVNACYQLNADSSDILLKISGVETAIRIPSPGLHNVKNALAASAVASVLGVPTQAIQQGLEHYQNAKGRLQVFAGVHGARVIDDTYNANPMSMKAAVDVLKTQVGQKILVLGDMGELGEDAAAMHEEIGVYAKTAQIDLLFVLGDLSINTVRGFGQGAAHYTALDVLVNDVVNRMQPDTTVLVKGSRFMAMERVVKEIVVAGKQ